MKKRFSFFILRKNFNNGEIESYDVMPTIYRNIYNVDGNFSENFYIYDNNYQKSNIDSKEKLYKFVDRVLKYYYWAKCEWEFISIDWPYRTECDENTNIININRPVKIDAYKQLQPNINLIVDLLWEDIKNDI